MTFRKTFLATALLAAPLSPQLASQVPYVASGQVYSQNFNWTTGGTVQNLVWQQNTERQTWALQGTSQLGWYASFDQPPTSFAITNGTANNGGGMLSNFFFTSTEQNRSLGGRPTAGAGPVILALRLRNDSPHTLTEFTIGYALAVTQQRDANVSNTAVFAYRVGGEETGWATAPFTEPGAGFNATTPLVEVQSNINGSLAANRTTISGQTVTGIEWAPGEDIWLRWTVPNVVNGPNVGLDDVVFIARNPDILTPPPPGNVQATQVGEDILRVTWDDQLQDGEGYIIERSTSAASGFAEVGRVPARTSFFDDGTATVGVLYHYRVRSLRGGLQSDPSTTVSIQRIVGPPAAPINGNARVVSSVSIHLTWQDNSFNELGYIIERSTGGGSFVEIGRVPSNRLTFTDSPVTPDTRYVYRIFAYNDRGLSDPLNIAEVRTPETPLQFASGPPDIDESLIGRTIHVSANSGNDANTGMTPGTAVRTIERAVAIGRGYNTQNIGVKILIAPGVYLEGEADRLVDFGAVNISGFFETSAPLIIEGAGWAPGVNTGDVILTGGERWTNWPEADSDGVHTRHWPYKWGLNPRAQAVAPDTIKRFEMIWVKANGVWQNYIQMDNASDPRIANLEDDDGWFWVSEADEIISIRPAPGVDLTDPDVVVKVTKRKRLMHHWRPQTATSLTPITIRNLVVEHSGDYGIYLQNMNSVVLEDLVFHRNKISGFSFGGGNGLRVSRSTFVDNSVSGFNGMGRNMLFEDLEISRNGRLAVYSGYTGWANQGFKLGMANHVTMRRLLMEDNYGVQAWFDTGMYNTELIDSFISGGLTSGFFIENNNPNNIPGLGATPTVIVRNNVIVNHITRSRFSNLVARGVSIGENYNALVENNLIVNNDHGIALAANIRGQSFFNVVRRNVISVIGEFPARLYHPRNALIDWQEFFDTLDEQTNDNIYINARETAFTNRLGQPISFADWQMAQFNNPNNTRTNKAVDSRSIHIMEDYAGQEMISIRVLRDAIEEGQGATDVIEFTRLATDLSQPLQVGLTYATGPGFASDADFAEPLPRFLTFPAGETKAFLRLDALADGIAEGEELLQLSLDIADPMVLAPISTATIRVIDLDAPDISQVRITTPPALWFESDGIRTLTLERTGSTSDELVVDLIVEGTAVEGVDYTLPSPTATFGAGQSSTTWTVQLLADDQPAVDKTLTVRVLPSDEGVYVIGFPNAVSFILRDESVFTFEGDPFEANPAVFALGIRNPAETAVTFSIGRTANLYQVNRHDEGLFDAENFSLPANASTVTFNWQTVNADGISNPIPIGFDFPFGDQTYSTVRVHSNGFITFEPLPDPSRPYRVPVDLPSTEPTAPRAMLAPFWTDLGVDAQSSVRFGRLDPQTFVVEYRNVPRLPVIIVAQRATFRVVLRANGSVYYQYVSSTYTGAIRAGFQNREGSTGSIIASTASALSMPSTFRLTPTNWIRPRVNPITAAPGETTWAAWDIQPLFLDYGIYEETFTLTNPASPFGEVEFDFSFDNRPFWMQAGWEPDTHGLFRSSWTGPFAESVRPWHYHAHLGWFIPLFSSPDDFLAWFPEFGWVAFHAEWAGFAYFYDSGEWLSVRPR